MQKRRFRLLVGAMVTAAVLGAQGGMTPALADSSLIRSLVFPGLGQAHKGHYTRAAIFASAAVATGAGLFLSQIQYNRAVERYESQKRVYAAYPRQLEAGTVIAFSDIENTFDEMTRAFNNSDDRVTMRNVFLVAFVGTYVLNIIDVMMIEKETGEVIDPISLEVTPDAGLRVVKTFSF